VTFWDPVKLWEVAPIFVARSLRSQMSPTHCTGARAEPPENYGGLEAISAIRNTENEIDVKSNVGKG
jgi:hypothetical protein